MQRRPAASTMNPTRPNYIEFSLTPWTISHKLQLIRNSVPHDQLKSLHASQSLDNLFCGLCIVLNAIKNYAYALHTVLNKTSLEDWREEIIYTTSWCKRNELGQKEKRIIDKIGHMYNYIWFRNVNWCPCKGSVTKECYYEDHLLIQLYD